MMKIQHPLRRRFLPILLTALILCAAILPYTPLAVQADDGRTVVTTPPTGYTQASDVVYMTFTRGSYSGVMNWGARGEDCVFLSPHAEQFYVDGYTYESLSILDGGTESTAPSSELYLSLKAMMVNEHTHIITYQNTRDLYAYTDCVSNDSTQFVSFYSGVLHSSVWNSGTTWNREHVWPNSKCIGNKVQDAADIMMLRPTLTEENGSRGNSAYGESGSFFDPGESVRGDCARILLYQYTRWGNTSRMWGSGGVIENLDVLLRWMEEDPVDTWEMGRNDAVESITGTRNVFVDYPEYAWLLFDRDIPDDVVTPSGIAASGDSRPTETETTTETESFTETTTETETESEFEMTQPLPPPETESEFEMTQPLPPPETESEFEMTQPLPPPEIESEFEMTQPLPPSETESVSSADTTERTEAEGTETSDPLPGTDLPTGDDPDGGCSSAAGGGVIMLLSLGLSAIAASYANLRRRK